MVKFEVLPVMTRIKATAVVADFLRCNMYADIQEASDHLGFPLYVIWGLIMDGARLPQCEMPLNPRGFFDGVREAVSREKS